MRSPTDPMKRLSDPSCECCGADGAGNLSRLCPVCFQALNQRSTTTVICAVHGNVMHTEHDR